MGYSLNHMEAFGPPFQVVHEQIVDVSPHGVHVVQNHVRKLLFVLYGECRHQIVRGVGPGSDVILRQGDVLALPHRCQQQYAPVHDGSEARLHVIRLSFDPALLPVLPLAPVPFPDALPGPDANLLVWADFALRETRLWRAAPDGVLSETLLQLRAETERHAPGVNVRVHSLCASLVLLFARSGIKNAENAERFSPSERGQVSYAGLPVEKIKRFLQNRLHQPIRLADVAAFVDLSPEHCARLFKSVTGTTVFDYVRRLRIAEAKSRLAATDANLSQIAFAVGFGSLTVFSRNFTREVGQTPSEFRRQIARQIG